jgi:hypothetical protein
MVHIIDSFYDGVMLSDRNNRRSHDIVTITRNKREPLDVVVYAI